ncbi:MAG: hypothetical protein JWQ09_4415 [Segetibacter sp.]|nr:hypothetical protein [Segetibacter sp.]
MNRDIKFRALDDGKIIYHDQVQPMLINNNDHLHWFFKIIREDAIIRKP